MNCLVPDRGKWRPSTSLLTGEPHPAATQTPITDGGAQKKRLDSLRWAQGPLFAV
jgi:hypothetical protein